MVGDHFGPLTKDNYDTAEIGKRTAAAAIIGGTAAAITGGDFVNGAQTAAYAQLYNAIKDYLDDINAALVPLPDGGAEAALAIDETAEGTIAVGEILEEDFQSLEYAGNVVTDAVEQAFSEANSAINGLKLQKYFASLDQMGQKGAIIAGGDSNVVFRNASKIVDQFGGSTFEWVKKTSFPFITKDGSVFETHWVENLCTGLRVEYKTKLIR